MVPQSLIANIFTTNLLFIWEDKFSLFSSQAQIKSRKVLFAFHRKIATSSWSSFRDTLLTWLKGCWPYFGSDIIHFVLYSRWEGIIRTVLIPMVELKICSRSIFKMQCSYHVFTLEIKLIIVFVPKFFFKCLLDSGFFIRRKHLLFSLRPQNVTSKMCLFQKLQAKT